MRQHPVHADRDHPVIRAEHGGAERTTRLRLDVLPGQRDRKPDLVRVGGIVTRGVDRVVHPGRQRQVDLRIQHQALPAQVSRRVTLRLNTGASALWS